jgi:hypothetical protein
MPKVVAEAIGKAITELISLIENDEESNKDEIRQIFVNRYGLAHTWYVYVHIQKKNPPRNDYTYKYVMHVYDQTGHIVRGTTP